MLRRAAAVTPTAMPITSANPSAIKPSRKLYGKCVAMISLTERLYCIDGPRSNVTTPFIQRPYCSKTGSFRW